MKKRVLVLFVLAVSGFLVGRVRADELMGKPHYTEEHPAIPEAPGEYEFVSGTVTVRLDGVLVNPQTISYEFSPAFTLNVGPLTKKEDGTYFLINEKVPLGPTYTLMINAVYNDAIQAADGITSRQGRTYSGFIKISIPYGEDYDFGNQFLDLH